VATRPRWNLDGFHVEVQQLAAEAQRGLGDVLGVLVGSDSQLNAEPRQSLFHAAP